MSLINYYVGIFKLKPNDLETLNNDIRYILNKFGMHKRPACKERLHLPRDELGRGLHSVEYRNKLMLLQLYNTLEESALLSTRRSAILKQEHAHGTHLATIVAYLTVKYGLTQLNTSSKVIVIKNVEEAQMRLLYSKIEKKLRHAKAVQNAGK
ncbi:hypothetical protein PAEPH01_1592 [Pancytospora epiphaga]|nr:hypothetical protein PAEPH01_1592 [Pancytospora epiphaga]